MPSITRDVFVISDLHLGGAPPTPASPDPARARGFRMMTHAEALAGFIRQLAALPAEPEVELVINGDFIDFLAEEHDGAERWLPFVYDPAEARRTFERIAARDGDGMVLAALRDLLAAGKRLTVLLGNHDLELSLPDVREAFEAALGHPPAGRYRFLYDDEALVVGDALIEHGNLYDPANVVDHDGLRKLRALRSRAMTRFERQVFQAPAGSHVVARVMNEIKARYAFIDLLKPEAEPLFGLLLAIEPGYRGILDELARALVKIGKNLVPSRDDTYFVRNVAGQAGAATNFLMNVGAAAPATSPLATVLADAGLPPDTVRTLLADSAPADLVANVASVAGARARLGLAALAAGGDWLAVERRLALVRSTVAVLASDLSWQRDREVERYQRWAEFLAASGPDRTGFRWVIFGHTHHAKDVELSSRARYFNTGTWADLMRFPPALLDPDDAVAWPALQKLATDIERNDLDAYREFHPTYVRLLVGDDGKVARAALHEYDWKGKALTPWE